MDQEISSLDQSISKPSFLRLMGEPIMLWKDMWQSHLFQKNYPMDPSGDGHPVLVIPGFLSSDQSTKNLRKFIKDIGYSPYGWELGTNMGDIRKLKILVEKIEELHDTYQSKVSVIGWSLGGVYARQMAKRAPRLFRQVITLGAPFADIEYSNNAAWLFRMIHEKRDYTETDLEWIQNLPAPAPVPSTAIYTKEDGIVHWRACMEQFQADWYQNIEVEGSHFGLPIIPSVWIVVEDRLKFRQKDWQPFEKKEYPTDLVQFPSL